ncbi:MAG TPA: glycoside hydrolase family 88 protein [Verrucomicrobiae bacterium]|jgi:rhamnogalacturonyl hydrolase YesR|nr:glycoside hydrolase family 88 protein [Verrucomicrobiae bacterium]
MHNKFKTSWILALSLLIAGCQTENKPSGHVSGPRLKTSPQAALDVMQRVADWQLAHPSDHKSTDWTCGAGDDGFMALAGISHDPKYRDAMIAVGQTNQWKLGPRKYHGDDQCIGQTYTELYFLYRDPKMIAPMREKFNWILNHPSAVTSLNFKQPHGMATEQWSWCDSLFMAPPSWVRLYAATGDERYLDFGVTNWWHTTDYLYDKDEHLYYRDSTFFNKHEANGQKVFWSRGNGWVMGGLVRMLQYLPSNHPDRPRFEQLFKDMAAKVVSVQQPDGLWHSSLLDPASYPMKETSGSGFFTYALAWGVNQGLLDRKTYVPAVQKAWNALVGCVDADGKLTHAQPVGADPKKFDPNATEIYAVGAFLLAGSEVYRMGVLQNSAAHVVKVSVTNPSDSRRDVETVELDINPAAISGNINDVLEFPKGTAAVMDGVSSRILDSQVYATETNYSKPNKLLFQVDLAPHETRSYFILDSSALTTVPQPIVKTFARYVPERYDDFAWESDRIAHRMYGPALETWQEEPLTSSGIDVWIKRTRNLVINQMYGTMKLFNTNGPSQDDFRVGKTRGCGGLGIWSDGTLHDSKNWRTWKVITTGPIRSEFELTYDAWDAGNGRMVSETKRISIDAGSNMSRVQSTLSSDDKSPLKVGIGLAERPGDNVFVSDDSPEIESWQNSTAKGLVVQNQNAGLMTYWQPQDFAKGVITTAIVLPANSIETFTNDNPDLAAEKFAPPTHTLGEGQPGLRSMLAIAPAQIGVPFVYYIGAGWNESGDFPNAASWNNYIRRFIERRDHPLQVAIGN